MMDMGMMMKAVGAWNTFKENHPKFPAFLQAVSTKGIKPDSIIEITITDPDGEVIQTNVRIKESDMELFRSLSK